MRKTALTVLLLCIVSALSASGGARRFTYAYEATSSPPGGVELENCTTRC